MLYILFLKEILIGAEFLQLADARVKCVKFFTENVMNDNNYLMIKEMADFRGITELSQNCIEYALSRFELVKVLVYKLCILFKVRILIL